MRESLTRLTTIAVLAVLAIPSVSRAQAGSPARVVVRVSAEGAPLALARVRADGNAAGAETNTAGVARLTLAPGAHVVRVARIGYAPDSARLTIAAAGDTTLAFELAPAAAEVETFVVTSGRGAVRLEDEPTRVEVLAGDDVAEKTEMRPNDLRNFLSEMAGVRMQLTSAATGAAAVRLQGLRPRYTLLLADGLPLYGGAGGGGLDLLQLPPADLRQIEVVKGPASALYGPSALGGTINLISKRPGNEGDVLLQGTSERGANAFGWISRRATSAVGYTGVVGAHTQEARDMDGDGWIDLPRVRRVEARPRLFVDLPGGGSLFFTASGTAEDRQGGGTILEGLYDERAETRRGDVGGVGHFLLGTRTTLQARAAANVRRQSRRFGTDPEHVTRATGFGELSMGTTRGVHDLLVGAALEATSARVPENRANDFNFAVASAFAQDVWRATEHLAATASARLDQHSAYGAHVSPRLSLLATLPSGLTARVSGTHGFYAPTPFVEEAEAVGVRRVRGFDLLEAESADYGSLDVTAKPGPLELNATLFAARVAHQVVATESAVNDGTLFLANAAAHARSRGVELFGIYDLAPLFVTALYTYTDSREPRTETSLTAAEAPYAPRHTGGIDVTWEDPARGTWIAVEAFYTGAQALEDDPYVARGHAYTTVGLLATQRVGRYKLFANVENLGDARQTRYAPLVLPGRSPAGRRTTHPWGPIEGRIFSVGVRVSSGDLAKHGE